MTPRQHLNPGHHLSSIQRKINKLRLSVNLTASPPPAPTWYPVRYISTNSSISHADMVVVMATTEGRKQNGGKEKMKNVTGHVRALVAYKQILYSPPVVLR